MGTTSADGAIANRYNQEYAYQVWGLVAPFLFLVGVIHYGSVTLGMLFPGKKEPRDVEADGRVARHRASIKRLPLVIVNACRVLAFRTSLTIGPFSLNLVEVTLTIAYIVALLVWSFINTTSLDGTRFARQYYMNRAANIACGQLPLVVALGTKNNIVGMITGLSHEKINYMHRMTARVVFILLWIHCGPRLSYMKPGSLHKELIQFGILAISTFSFLIVISLRPIRKATYELFFFIHFVMVLVFLVAGYIHTQEAKVTYWFWVSFIIWGLDRLIRVVRLVAFNHSYFGFKKGTGTIDASVELLSPHFVRLRLPKPPHFHWSPGQAAYLIMPGVSTIPFEAHPFTIASVDTMGNGTRGKSVQKTGKGALAELYWKELVFLINVHSGFTRKLRDVAEKGGKARVFVDGPYGKPPDLTGYDTSVLIAGGSGVSFTLPLLLDGVRNAASGKSNTKRIAFIWSIRDRSHIAWISEALGMATKLTPAGLEISIRIYVTGDSTTQPWGDVSIAESGKEIHETELKIAPPSLFEDPTVQITSGCRPNLKYILQTEADMTAGRMGVTVCGSPSITAAVKESLGFSIAGPSTIMKGGPSITLHSEAFGYA